MLKFNILGRGVCNVKQKTENQQDALVGTTVVDYRTENFLSALVGFIYYETETNTGQVSR